MVEQFKRRKKEEGDRYIDRKAARESERQNWYRRTEPGQTASPGNCSQPSPGGAAPPRPAPAAVEQCRAAEPRPLPHDGRLVDVSRRLVRRLLTSWQPFQAELGILPFSKNKMSSLS